MTETELFDMFVKSHALPILARRAHKRGIEIGSEDWKHLHSERLKGGFRNDYARWKRERGV